VAGRRKTGGRSIATASWLIWAHVREAAGLSMTSKAPMAFTDSPVDLLPGLCNPGALLNTRADQGVCIE
jgi:hypothetical protein